MKVLDNLVSKAKRDGEILAVMTFGSYARGERHRDIDVCLVLKKEAENGDMSRKRLAYVSGSGLDVHVFQQIPLYIRVRVLREGKVLFCRNLDALYDVAGQTVREFAYFEPAYRGYLEAVKHG
jgi:predicted nucleotidyltransferase